MEGPARAVKNPTDIENAALTIANYIDLNPVRAGLCSDPKDYRFCGYGEAVAGSKRARRGLCRVMGLPLDAWTEATLGRTCGSDYYRCLLFGRASELKDERTGQIKRQGVSRKKALAVLEKGGKLSRQEALRCRVRFFSDGAVLGSKQFVDDWARDRPDQLSERRQKIKHPGARPLLGLATSLKAFRQLRVRVVE